MKNRSSFLLLMALLVASSAGFAQSLTAVDSTGSAPSGVIIPGPDDLLWDNTQINNVGSGIVSLRGADLPAGADRVNAADDFVVPAGLQWNVTFVYSEGFSNAATNADAFGVVIYEDAGGVPGAVISEQTVPFGGGVTMATQELPLPAPVQLGAGTYWVSVYGIYDPFVDLATTRWNWSFGNTAIGNDAALQDTGSFFGATLPWTPLGGLGVTDAQSLVFALRGTETSALPESVPVPTLSQWGLILLVLALAGLAGTVLVRRA